MNPNRDKAKGQALIDFAINLIVLFIIAIIESGRLFQSWITGHNTSRATGRYSLTGQFETECLSEFPAYPDARVNSINDEALNNIAGLITDRLPRWGAPFFHCRSGGRHMMPNRRKISNCAVTPSRHTPIVNLTYAIIGRQGIYYLKQQNIPFAGRSSIDNVQLKAKP